MTESISTVLDKVVALWGLCLETVKIGRGGESLVVRVVVDLSSGPGGVDSDRPTEVSRDISQRLNDVNLAQGAYTPEVSTPGVECSLREPRHFSRAQDRLVELRTVDEKSVVGRLMSLSDDALDVQIEGNRRNVLMAEVVFGCVKIDMSRAPQSAIKKEEG